MNRVTLIVDMDDIKEKLEWLALDEHKGDVADTLGPLCVALGLPEPVYDDICERMVFEWEPPHDSDE